MDTVPAPSSRGLSQTEAAQRLHLHGLNEIKHETTRSPWLLLAEQFKSPLVIILIFACILSGALGEYIEAVAIGAILVINALIGFFQEYRAETAIMALQEMTAPRAKVLRDGHQQVIPAHDIVPGDVLLLEAGDIVAADGTLLETARLAVNEAVLTGESVPAEKKVADGSADAALAEKNGQVFMGTSVAAGTGTVLVTATGMRTELGRIAHLIATAQTEPTPLQVQLTHIGRALLVVSLGVVCLVAVIGLVQGRPWMDLLVFSLSLAVAAVPEGMPAIVTVALALGVQRLAARHALIRKLPSVETLGSVTVICTDKTGTLTTGNMRIREVWGHDHHLVVEAAASCCDAELDQTGTSGVGDPTELAILIDAYERGMERRTIETQNPRVSAEPFDAERRRMSILRANGTNYVKGAVESIFALCRDTPSHIDLAKKAAIEMSERGLRVLAVATGQGAGERELNLVGLLGIADPPRTEAAEAIKEARGAGIIPVMITGDHPKTATAIAREMGLVLENDPLHERVHARATPEDKLRLVRQWKNDGHIVAMTGDGVNDAPALREAHIGIAMGKTGTEVTRQAADLILADDNFATIVAAVSEGRSIFQNIRRAISYLLVGNLAEIAIVLFCIVLGLPMPLLAAHLLWINLVTDAFPALTLIAEPLSPLTMKRPPRPAGEPLLGRPEWSHILAVGLIEAGVCIVMYWLLLRDHAEDHARGLLFSGLVFSQLVRSFSARCTTRTLWEAGVFTNLWLLGVVLITGALQASLHFIPFTQKLFGLAPFGLEDLTFVLPFALIPVSLLELKKVGQRLVRPT